MPWLPDLSVMFGAGYDLKDLSARTITCLTGYLRPRPDPSLEALLRDAFDRFDRDLSNAMDDPGGRPQVHGE